MHTTAGLALTSSVYPTMATDVASSARASRVHSGLSRNAARRVVAGGPMLAFCWGLGGVWVVGGGLNQNRRWKYGKRRRQTHSHTHSRSSSLRGGCPPRRFDPIRYTQFD